MTRRLVLAVAAAASLTLLLAGCVPKVRAPERKSTDRAKVLVRQQAVSSWQYISLTTPREMPDLPQIHLVSDEDWAAEVTSCIARAGFGEYFDYVSGDILDVSTSARTDDAMVANFLCLVAYAYDPRTYTFTDDQLDYLYAYYEHWLIPCLFSHGERAFGKPGRAQFAEQGGYWNPYSSVYSGSSAADHAQFAALQGACPSYPGGLAISGHEYPAGG